MTQAKYLILLLTLLTVYTVNAQEEYGSFNEEMSIAIDGDSIAVYALIAPGKELKETVILLHGIPGNERSLDLAQELRSNGRNAIFFNYRGSWGSQGEYLYSNCLEDVNELIAHFSQPSVSQKLRIDSNRFVLIGHSLGGGIALIQGAWHNQVQKIIALSATNFGYASREIDSVDQIDDFRGYIQSAFMLNCDARAFLQEILDNKTAYDALSYRSELAEKRVLIVDDFDRSDSWPGELSKVTKYVILESDHSFTNKRKELIQLVLDWL